MTVALLNLFRLALTVVAAFMMWLFPPRMAYYTEKGEQIIQRVGWADAGSPTYVMT